MGEAKRRMGLTAGRIDAGLDSTGGIGGQEVQGKKTEGGAGVGLHGGDFLAQRVVRGEVLGGGLDGIEQAGTQRVDSGDESGEVGWFGGIDYFGFLTAWSNGVLTNKKDRESENGGGASEHGKCHGRTRAAGSGRGLAHGAGDACREFVWHGLRWTQRGGAELVDDRFGGAVVGLTVGAVRDVAGGVGAGHGVTEADKAAGEAGFSVGAHEVERV